MHPYDLVEENGEMIATVKLKPGTCQVGYIFRLGTWVDRDIYEDQFVDITGIISGTADQTAVKAMKLTISGMIPVVGGILADASETILISAGVMKNAVDIYGLFAIVAVAIGPFLSIGVQYLLLKITASVCATFSGKTLASLLDDFSSAMGLLLAMTGSVCFVQIISVVCFLRGVT